MVYAFVVLTGGYVEISIGCIADIAQYELDLLKLYENKENDCNILNVGCCGITRCFKCHHNPKCFKCTMGGIKIPEVKTIGNLGGHLVNAVYVEEILKDIKKEEEEEDEEDS